MEFLECAAVEVEVLGCQRWSERADALEGRAPQAWNEVGREREGGHGEEEAEHRHVLGGRVVAETDLAEEVDAQEDEEHNPDGEEYLAVEDAPAVGEVGDGEEFKREDELDEAQDDLDGVEP